MIGISLMLNYLYWIFSAEGITYREWAPGAKVCLPRFIFEGAYIFLLVTLCKGDLLRGRVMDMMYSVWV